MSHVNESQVEFRHVFTVLGPPSAGPTLPIKSCASPLSRCGPNEAGRYYRDVGTVGRHYRIVYPGAPCTV